MLENQKIHQHNTAFAGDFPFEFSSSGLIAAAEPFQPNHEWLSRGLDAQ